MADKKFSELTAATSLAADDVLAIETAAGVSKKIAGSSLPMLMSSKNISSVQLLDLHNTPVELLAAPGGRLYYDVHDIVMHYRFATTPYAHTGSTFFRFAIGYGSAAADIGGAGLLLTPLAPSGGAPGIDPRTFFENIEDAYILAPANTTALGLYGWLASAVEDAALSVCISNADGALTLGDGTLTIRTFYTLIDGAP